MNSKKINFIFYVILFLPLSIFAQSKVVSIQWLENKTITVSSGQEFVLPNFKDAVYPSQLNFAPSFVIVENSYVSDFKIIDAVYESIPSANIKIENSDKTFYIETGSQRKSTISKIFIAAIRQNSNTQQWERLVSFSYSFSRGTNNIRSRVSRLNTSPNPTSSVLSTGDWYKMAFINSGIYKVDYSTLKSWGVDVDNINPKNIAIFGNGAKMLPQANAEDRAKDLIENNIVVIGEEDGKFDAQDYILFYVSSPTTWNLDLNNQLFKHVNNIYTDSCHYFLTIKSGTTGQRVQNQSSIAVTSTPKTTFDERIAFEKDEVNLLKSGRQWYGSPLNLYNNFQQNVSFTLNGICKDSILNVTSAVLGKSTGPVSSTISFDITLNSKPLGTQTMNESGSVPYTTIAIEKVNTFEYTVASIPGNEVFNFNYLFKRASEPTATGYINYIDFNFKKNLKLYNGQVSFRSIDSRNQIESSFAILGVQNTLRIWDVTNPLEAIGQEYELKNDSAIFGYLTSNSIREFVAFSGSSFSGPLSVVKILNQNLHALNPSNLLIITHPKFLSSANKLAAHRRSNDNLSVQVVSVTDIYNEFSSGNQDITAIRDFIKMIYDKNSSGPDSLEYVLLFGDCSYDYKNRISGNTNYVPVYESINSLHPVNSYSSDDFFGFMDENEGLWGETPAENYYLDLGIGRIPCNSVDQAEAVVAKLINYSNKSVSYNPWKNNIAFIADAGDSNLHLSQADQLASNLESINPSININKIYLDAFPFKTAPDGVSAPDCNKAINEAVENGSLLINYTGHGGTAQLSVKRVITIPQITSWKNADKLALFVTATCEFGTYDDPGFESAGEQILLTPNGAGVGLVTTTRPVYSNSNFALNNAFYSVIFTKVNGKYPRLGNAVVYTKNNALYDVVNRNYALLGDPSMKLAYAENNISLTSINNAPIASDTLNALEKVNFKGQINDNSNLKLSSFNGTLYITVYDKKSNIKTLGQDGSIATTVKALNSIIYSGQASVVNGDFNFSFVVPKDISYQIDYGKISLYAKETNLTTDASGYNNQILIGGSSKNAKSDNIPPVIKLFMNDESFVNGGITNYTPKLIALISDSNGINITGSGIGHELSGVLNNNDKDVIVLNKYFSSKKDDYTSGRVDYQLNLEKPGQQTIRVKAWDTYNNSSEASLDFVVASDEKLALSHVLNYPNPFTSNTNFHFDHNRAGEDLSVQVQVFTTSGKLIKTLQTEAIISKSHFSELNWDGKDDYGDNIGKGVYVYKVSVRSKRDNSETHTYEKLVILN